MQNISLQPDGLLCRTMKSVQTANAPAAIKSLLRLKWKRFVSSDISAITSAVLFETQCPLQRLNSLQIQARKSLILLLPQCVSPVFDRMSYSRLYIKLVLQEMRDILLPCLVKILYRAASKLPCLESTTEKGCV